MMTLSGRLLHDTKSPSCESFPCPTIGMLSYLQEKYDAVIALHNTHYEAALQLQARLRSEVLGRLVEERQLDDRGLSWAREWVDDYGK